MTARRHRGAGRSPCAFTTVERDRRYRQAYEVDAEARERLRAGIEEFREMLEALSKRQEVYQSACESATFEWRFR